MSGTLLKLIALFAMTLDHTFKIFADILPAWPVALPGGVMLSMSAVISNIGRTAFPVFAVFTAMGCRYTSNRRAYIKRLFVFALLSEIPFDLALMGDAFLTHQNVLFTLCLGALSIELYETLKKKYGYYSAALLPLIIFTVFAKVLHVDYGGFGVLLVFILYLCRQKRTAALAMLGMILLYYVRRFPVSGVNFVSLFNWAVPLFFTALSVPLVYFYNGRRGKGLKFLFYIYYPAHLLFLYGLKLFLI